MQCVDVLVASTFQHNDRVSKQHEAVSRIRSRADIRLSGAEVQRLTRLAMSRVSASARLSTVL